MEIFNMNYKKNDRNHTTQWRAAGAKATTLRSGSVIAPRPRLIQIRDTKRGFAVNHEMRFGSLWKSFFSSAVTRTQNRQIDARSILVLGHRMCVQPLAIDAAMSTVGERACLGRKDRNTLDADAFFALGPTHDAPNTRRTVAPAKEK